MRLARVKAAALAVLVAACGLDLAGELAKTPPPIEEEDALEASLPEALAEDANDGATDGPVSCGNTMTSMTNCGACGHDCKGASCTNGLCQPETLASNLGTPRGIAVASGIIYVADSSSGNIYSIVPPTGVAVLHHATGKAPRAVVERDGSVWWGDQIELGLKPLIGVASVNPIDAGVRSLVLANDRLYYATGNNRVESRDLALAALQVHANGAASPLGVTANATHVYWAAVDSGTVGRAPLPGGDGGTVVADAGINTRSVAIDATNVYWTNDTQIVKATIETWEPTVLVSGEGKPLSLIHDNGFLYWVDASNGTVRRVSVNGGPALTLANEPQGTFDYAQLLAVDATHLYYIGTVAPGSLRRVAK